MILACPNTAHNNQLKFGFHLNITRCFPLTTELQMHFQPSTVDKVYVCIQEHEEVVLLTEYVPSTDNFFKARRVEQKTIHSTQNASPLPTECHVTVSIYEPKCH